MHPVGRKCEISNNSRFRKFARTRHASPVSQRTRAAIGCFRCRHGWMGFGRWSFRRRSRKKPWTARPTRLLAGLLTRMFYINWNFNYYYLINEVIINNNIFFSNDPTRMAGDWTRKTINIYKFNNIYFYQAVD